MYVLQVPYFTLQSCIRLAGHIKFKSNFSKTDSTELQTNRYHINNKWLKQRSSLADAVAWKERDRPRHAADCISLSVGILSRVLEDITVTPKSPSWRQLQPLVPAAESPSTRRSRTFLHGKSLLPVGALMSKDTNEQTCWFTPTHTNILWFESSTHLFLDCTFHLWTYSSSVKLCARFSKVWSCTRITYWNLKSLGNNTLQNVMIQSWKEGLNIKPSIYLKIPLLS